MIRALPIAIALAGCNLVYGLDETRPIPFDPDDDFVFEDDNCPTVANEDQADRDQDGVGDACDTCGDVFDPTNHDEDGDQFGDLCDLCETVPDFQFDTDHDSISDDCEVLPGVTISKRLVFDAFQTLDRTRWNVLGAEWEERDDSIASPAAGPTDPGLAAIGAEIGPRYFNIDLGVTATKPWSAGDRFGVRLVDPMGVTNVRCEVSCQPACELELELAGTLYRAPVPTSRPIEQLRLFMSPNEPTDIVLCQVQGVANLGFHDVFDAGSLVIEGGGAVELSYIGAWVHQR